MGRSLQLTTIFRCNNADLVPFFANLFAGSLNYSQLFGNTLSCSQPLSAILNCRSGIVRFVQIKICNRRARQAASGIIGRIAAIAKNRSSLFLLIPLYMNSHADLPLRPNCTRPFRRAARRFARLMSFSN